MSRLIQAIGKFSPHRRKRFWRYVSPRRHGVGTAALAVLMLMVYAYWRQTNDRHVRRTAEDYLSRLTGGRVRIHRAQFHLFGEIEVENVRLYIPGSGSPDPLFRAGKVQLRHEPWGLLLGGRLRPTEIVCLEPTLTLEYLTGEDRYVIQDFLAGRGLPQPVLRPQSGLRLPSIRLRGGRMVVIDVDGQSRQPAGEVPFDVTMLPRQEGQYVIRFEEPSADNSQADDRLQGQLVLDLNSGHVEQASGNLPLEALDKALPRRYRRWRQRYQLKGNVELRRTLGTVDSNDILVAELMDVSMKLPEEEGALELGHVRGSLAFRDDVVELRGISGLVPQAGDARFRMTGRYDGYEGNSPFEVRLEIEGMSVPEPGSVSGGLADALALLRRNYAPAGAMDLDMKLRRDAAGALGYEGRIIPRGLSICYRNFPYRVDDLTGAVVVRPGRIELEGLRARRGEAVFELNGSVEQREDGGDLYDLSVGVQDALLDAELRDALPESFLVVWDALNPSGRTGALVRVWRGSDDAHERTAVSLRLDGRMSMQYDGFPYRLSELRGEVRIAGPKVEIDAIRGRHGQGEFLVNGELNKVTSREGTVRLSIEGANVALDEDLAVAAKEAGRAAWDELRPEGAASKVSAEVWKEPGQPVDFRVAAELDGVRLWLRSFPYAIESTAARVTILPDRALIEQLQGRHGQATISATGQVHLGGDFALDLVITGSEVVFDEDLRQALPDSVQAVWREISPGGLADLSLLLRLAGSPVSDVDYRLELDARDMSVTCRAFPYPFGGIRGRVVATPQKVVLENLLSSVGDSKAVVAGTFHPLSDANWADLSLRAHDVPIDQTLLAAFPADLAPLTRRFQPGGRCEIDFRSLRLHRPAGSASHPASQPATGLWDLDGSATLHEALVDLGFGVKTMTGEVRGRAGHDPTGFFIDAEMAMDSVAVGAYQMTGLTGRLVKGPSGDALELRDLVADAYGGRVAGTARARLVEPLQYDLSLAVDRLRLEELFAATEGPGDASAADGKDEKKKFKVGGLLLGNLTLTETVGQLNSRQAVGELWIRDSRMGKLPVFLDMLTVVFLSLPQTAAFDEGVFLYHLKGNQIVFHEIYLNGPALSLVGSGTMDVKTQQVKLHFLTRPGWLPRMRGLADEFFTGIFREIAEIEITGTLTEPRTRARTLRSVEEAIATLLRPAEQ